MDGFVFRPPIPGDADAVARVMNACAIAETGRADTSPEDVLESWSSPGIDIDLDELVVVDGAGNVVGAMSVDVRADGTARFDGYVHPTHTGRGIGTQLLEWAERRAREIGAPSAHHGVYANTAASKLLEERGFVRTRTFHEMTIDLDDTPAPAEWPDGIVVRSFPEAGRSLDDVYDAVREAFEDHWGGGLQEDQETFVHRISDGRQSPDTSLWLLALDEGAIAGTIFARERSAQDPDSGWVRYVAVRRPWRKRGLARALLLHMFATLRERSVSHAGLFVDSENLTGATRVYEAAGMRVQRRVDHYEKSL